MRYLEPGDLVKRNCRAYMISYHTLIQYNVEDWIVDTWKEYIGEHFVDLEKAANILMFPSFYDMFRINTKHLKNDGKPGGRHPYIIKEKYGLEALKIFVECMYRQKHYPTYLVCNTKQKYANKALEKINSKYNVKTYLAHYKVPKAAQLYIIAAPSDMDFKLGGLDFAVVLLNNYRNFYTGKALEYLDEVVHYFSFTKGWDYKISIGHRLRPFEVLELS